MQAVMKLAINSNQPTTNFYYTLLVHGALANVQIDSMLRMFNVNSRYANKLRECQNKLYVMNSTSWYIAYAYHSTQNGITTDSNAQRSHAVFVDW